MAFLTSPRLALAIALLIGATVATLAYRDHVYESGVSAESTRRDAIDARNSLAATQARDDLNARIRLLQGMLDVARDQVAKLKSEFDDANKISAQRSADLLAGRDRERVLVRTTCTASQTDPAGQAAGAGAGAVDQGTSIETDLDPGVASALERLRAEHNAAIERLGACIQSYDAVKAASDELP